MPKKNKEIAVRMPECPEDHTPNEVTKKALENALAEKGLKQAKTIEELFKKLGE